MTTIILVGGSETKAPTHFGERLAREVGFRFEKAPRILSCQFAKSDPAAQIDSAREWADFFANYIPQSHVEFAIPEEFYHQAEAADIIYLHGGETNNLFTALPDFARSRQVFHGKVVIGASAGANYLAAAGYSPKAQTFYEGCGIAPVSVLVHYGSTRFLSARQWHDIAGRMRTSYGRDVVCLSEGEFVVIEAGD